MCCICKVIVNSNELQTFTIHTSDCVDGDSNDPNFYILYFAQGSMIGIYKLAMTK